MAKQYYNISRDSKKVNVAKTFHCLKYHNFLKKETLDFSIICSKCSNEEIKRYLMKTNQLRYYYKFLI